MSVNTTLAGLSTNPALNGPDGSTDLPSSLDDAIRYALSFIAQIRDGAGIPTGMVGAFAGSAAPVGWIKMNGALLSRTTYAALWAYAQTQGPVSEATWTATNSGSFSVGDGSTTFRIPDGRGVFLRGWDDGRGVDAARGIGTFQDQANQPHTHGLNDPTHVHGYSDPTHTHTGNTTANGDHTHFMGGFVGAKNAGPSGGGSTDVGSGATDTTGSAGSHAHNLNVGAAAIGISITAAGTGMSVQSSGTEARPKNIALPLFIKY